MNTRFSPSLNGSLHLGHLAMAWVNRTYAQMNGGLFILRFDDLAPQIAGDPVDQMGEWAQEAEATMCRAGLPPDRVTYVSSHGGLDSGLPTQVGGQNRWLRPASYEGHFNLLCSPALVAARVKADIAENIGAVIRGEDLLPELQLYDYLNAQLGGRPREMIYLPRVRVRCGGEVTTISKTFGNLQLRDLFAQAPPALWLQKVQNTMLLDADRGLSWDNINPNPIIEID